MSTDTNKQLLEKAVRSIKESKNKINALEKEKSEPIAIIGTSCRLPGNVYNLDSLHTLLTNKTDAICDIPIDRWDVDTYYSSQREKGKIYATQAGIIENIDCFDNNFFKISPAEAKMIDPQHRILLELAWEALENSNILPETLYNKLTGVFVGISSVDYLNQISKLVDEKELNGYIASGNTSSTASGRISYNLGLKGPCMVMDTACSSSLTAIHQACESLRRKECNLALTGGVNLLVSPLSMMAFSQAGMLSPDNKCHTFDDKANGYVRSEGAGMIVLKRMSDAIKDGDEILAKIIGSAINHNGPSGGLTVPNGTSQKELIQKALQNAQIIPDQIDYIEAHGTGTSLGDPIEINALHKTFSDSKTKETPLLVGSIKTNIGHLEAAAGIAGVLKMVLQLKNQQIYPHLHFENPSTHIKWNDIAINIPTENIPWEFDKEKRIGGVSSFGVNGSNAHIIIEEYTSTTDKTKENLSSQFSSTIFMLSAKNKDRLDAYCKRMLEYLHKGHESNDIGALGYTLQTSREFMQERLAIVAKSKLDLKEKLQKYLQGTLSSNTVFSGNIKENKTALPLMGKSGEIFIKNAIEYKEWDTIAQLWVSGVTIDWKQLYQNSNTPKKIKLPIYPFDRKKHWIHLKSNKKDISVKKIHPLIHQNQSNLSEQIFTSIFDGQESFLQDHKILNKKMFPGVGYIELAIKAAELSVYNNIYGLKNIFWLEPLKINQQAVAIETQIFYSEEELCFQVFSINEENKKELAQGTLLTAAPTIPKIKNVNTIRDGLGNSKNQAQCYTFFESLGLSYGESFKGIQHLYFNQNEAISKIKLPKDKDFALQPGIIDAALQTCLAFKFLSNSNSLEIPYHAEEVTIYNRLPSEVWCYALKRQTLEESSLTVCDIHILDHTGATILEIKGFFGVSTSNDKSKNIANATSHDEDISSANEKELESLKNSFITYTIGLLSEELDQPKDIFKLDVPLEEYGIDSIAIHTIADQLEIHFDNVPRTILFEYQTIDELFDYFIKNHFSDLKKLMKKEVIENNDLRITKKNKQRSDLIKKNCPKQFDKKTKELSTINNVSDIAIIGLGGIFPESENLEQLWSNVLSENGLKEILKVKASDYGYGKINLEQNTKFIDNLGISIEKYNGFGYQLKLILHVLGQAFDAYNISLDQFSRKKTGIFIGAQQLFPDEDKKFKDGHGQIQLSYLIPNTISFLLNLSGPSEVINTYCTSVYVALHKAIQSIENGECDQAIVGGVNSISEQDFIRDGFDDFKTLLSNKNETKSFCQSGTGFIRSEGAGIILIKKLDVAENENNTILAKVKSTSVSHHGRSFSLESPSAKGIKSVIYDCITKAKIDASTIDYIEAHGIANPVSDAIELGAINQAYIELSSNPSKKWVIGSIKPTIGHPELASGAASLIKTVKALQYKKIPGIQNFDKLTSELSTSHSFIFRSESRHWENGISPRRAALNSYAVGGVNAHIILEEYQDKNIVSKDDLFEEQRNILKTEKSLDSNTGVVERSLLNELFSKGTEQQREIIEALAVEILDVSVDDLSRDTSLYDFDSSRLMRMVRSINDSLNIELGVGEVLSIDNFGDFFTLLEHKLLNKIKNHNNGDTSQKIDTVKNHYLLSEGQKGLFFIQSLEVNAIAYNIPIAFTIAEKIEKNHFLKALSLLQKEFPILKANFINDEQTGEILQKISLEGKEVLLSYKENKKSHETLLDEFKKLLRIPFDLRHDSLIRAHIRYDEDQTHILFSIHHIIFDGFSAIIFMGSFMKKLKQIRNDSAITIIDPELGYFDFISWEQSYMNSPRGEKSISYWREKLTNKSLLVNIPYDKKTTVNNPKQGIVHYETITIKKQQLQEARELASNLNVNLSVFILGVFSILLSKLSGDKEISIITPIMGRPHKKHEQSLGYFINMMIIHCSLASSKPFKELVENIRQEFIEGIDHSIYPFSKLVSTLNLNKSNPHSFNISYNFQSFFDVFDQNIDSSISGFKIWEDIYQEVEDDYGIEVYDLEKELRVGIKYQYDLFETATIKRHLGYFQNLLNGILKKPDEEFEFYEMIPKKEKNQLLVEFNTVSKKPILKESTVIHLFEEQALKTPENIAITFEGISISYKKLNEYSNQLAHLLQDKGVKEEDLIGICTERSIEMIISILGVLKSGTAYVPLMPDYPKDRITHIIEDTRLNLVLVDSTGDQKIAIYKNTERLIINKELSLLSNYPITSPSIVISPFSTAYVIYTSGSTGLPKGVLIEHRSLVDCLCTEIDLMQLNKTLITSLTTNYVFDVSLLEMFLPLIVGGKLIIPTDQCVKEIDVLITLLDKEKVNLLQGTPSFFNAFVELLDMKSSKLENLKRVCIGGESLNNSLVSLLKKKLPWLNINNHYGPTETTIDAIVLEDIKMFDRNILGKPLTNTSIYILDTNQKLLPLGAIGELYVGGSGVAREYLNNELLTKEKFINNPFVKNSRMYRTGDFARWLPDGNIEFFGRKDTQIKLRGHRIELGEIESALENISYIQKAIVVVKSYTNETKYLVAYIISKSKNKAKQIEITLKDKLPDYMIPKIFIDIESLPLTVNAKVDYQALPEIDLDAVVVDGFVAPNSKMEKSIANSWKKILGLKKIGIHSNFFDLGGDSILAIKLQSEIQKKVHKDIAVKSIFNYPTISDFAKFLEDIDANQSYLDTAIDLKNESRLELDFSNLAILRPYNEIPENIFLTGATGFVGVYLLNDLLIHTNAKIYCMVRANTIVKGKERIVDKLKEYRLYKTEYPDRIIPVLGDLSKKGLGINKKMYTTITRHVDFIYHAASFMNHLATYDQLKKPNVEGNIEILKIASTIKLKKIIYISTVDGLDQGAKEKASRDHEVHKISSGYGGSKWVGEKLMSKAKNKGIPIQIYRLGLVTGDSNTGKIPKNQWFRELLKSCSELGFYAEEIAFPITPVDYISRSITLISLKKDIQFNIFHLSNPQFVSLEKFFTTPFGRSQGIKKSSLKDWLLKMRQRRKEIEILPILKFIDFETEEIKDIIKEKSNFKRFDIPSSEDTEEILTREVHIKFPDLKNYCDKYLEAIFG